MFGHNLLKVFFLYMHRKCILSLRYTSQLLGRVYHSTQCNFLFIIFPRSIFGIPSGALGKSGALVYKVTTLCQNQSIERTVLDGHFVMFIPAVGYLTGGEITDVESPDGHKGGLVFYSLNGKTPHHLIS